MRVDNCLNQEEIEGQMRGVHPFFRGDYQLPRDPVWQDHWRFDYRVAVLT
jgi:hypothetical protein